MKNRLIAVLAILMFLIAPIAHAAIAFDAKSSGSGSNVTSVTVSHTVSGSNTILFVSVGTKDGGGGAAVSGVTYNGVAMTNITTQNISSAYYQDLWYLINPSTGTNNIVASFGGVSADQAVVSAASYTGVLQISPLTTANTNQNSSANSLSSTVTTSVDNSFVVSSVAFDGDGSNQPAVAGGETQRDVISPNTIWWAGLSDVVDVTAGAISTSWSSGGSASKFLVSSVGFAPAATATGTPPPSYSQGIIE